MGSVSSFYNGLRLYIMSLIDEVQEKIEANIKEAKHWVGSWDELRKLIDMLEDNEKEKPYEQP